MHASLPATGLTEADLATLLASDLALAPYPQLLRWLIWCPLLSIEQLTRLEQTRSYSRIAAHVLTLQRADLVAALVMHEPGWPPHHRRYLVTDAGLALFAAQSKPPLAVRHLAQAYPVERSALLARLARIGQHLVLAEVFTQLAAADSSVGFPLISYQQPWWYTDDLFGQHYTLQTDAALLLAPLQGTLHGFYVCVDADVRRPLLTTRERLLLLRLLQLRHALHLARETMPPLLIFTDASRLHTWGTLLERVSRQQGTALLDGAMTTLDALHREGLHAPIWWPFAHVVAGSANGMLAPLAISPTPLARVLGNPLSPTFAEYIARRQTLTHLLSEHPPTLRHAGTRPLPRVVGPLLRDLSARLPATLLAALHGTLAEQREATATMNLRLSRMQKELLWWLAHHPLLTAQQIARLHAPRRQATRGIQQQISTLLHWQLLVLVRWTQGQSWHERERYVLAEAALRYIALREGQRATWYLRSPKEHLPKSVQTLPALAIQQGTAGLFVQMQHTHGLYECMTHLLVTAQQEQIQLVTWKNASEAVRSYLDPLTHHAMQIRPDAELLYRLPGQDIACCVLIEYDRASTVRRDYEAKYQSYADYQAFTHLTLPPILTITQHAQAAARLRTCLARMTPRLSVCLLLEEQVQQVGWLTLLAQGKFPS